MTIVLLTVFILIFSLQIILAIDAYRFRNTSKNIFGNILGNTKIDSSALIELISKEFTELEFLAESNLEDPISVDQNVVIVNKKSLGKKDLFTNLFIIVNIYLSRKSLPLLKNYLGIQNIIFITELIALLTGVFWNNLAEVFISLAIVLAVIILFITAICEYNYNKFITEFIDIAETVLELDGVERARSEVFITKYKKIYNEYPIELIWRFLRVIGLV